MKDNPAFPFKALLIGDDAKIMEEETTNGYGDPYSMRSIYLYTWVETIIQGYKELQVAVRRSSKNMKPRELIKQAKDLEGMLKKSLPSLREIKMSAQRVSRWLNRYENKKKISRNPHLLESVSDIIKELEQLYRGKVAVELLETSEVIFCTLSSAGAATVKRSMINVDDMIVDEAAASTEPELYIPFHLQPSRLLAVGDPRQLPATLLSQRALELGLSISLHERLMDQCSWKPIMLEQQYRMKPEIRAFPSKRFYHGKLQDGPNVVR